MNPENHRGNSRPEGTCPDQLPPPPPPGLSRRQRRKELGARQARVNEWAGGWVDVDSSSGIFIVVVVVQMS